MVRMRKLGVPVHQLVRRLTRKTLNEPCKQCDHEFDKGWRRPVTYKCDHVRCLFCVMDTEDCFQCDKVLVLQALMTPPGPLHSVEPPPLNKEEPQCPILKRQEEDECSSIKDEATEIIELPQLQPQPGSSFHFRSRIPSNVTMTLVDSHKPVYKCEICYKSFRTRAHANYHQFCGNANAEKPFRCKKCGRGFVTRNHYQYYQAHAHPSSPPTNGRPSKPISVSTTKTTQRSEKSDETKAIPPSSKPQVNCHGQQKKLVCKNCKKQFTSRYNFRRHNRKICHLVSPDNPLKCKHKECFKRKPFKSERSLRRHLVQHLRRARKPFQCTNCNARFTRKDNLLAHQRTSCAKAKK